MEIIKKNLEEAIGECKKQQSKCLDKIAELQGENLELQDKIKKLQSELESNVAEIRIQFDMKLRYSGQQELAERLLVMV